MMITPKDGAIEPTMLDSLGYRADVAKQAPLMPVHKTETVRQDVCVLALPDSFGKTSAS